MERLHRFVLVRGEGEVDVLGQRALVVHQREREVGAARTAREPARRASRRSPAYGAIVVVEALRRLRVANAQPEVVDPAIGPGRLACAVHRLDAVAVRVEQEAAVVVGAVRRARPGRAVVGWPASMPACQKASTAARSRRLEGDVHPRVTGCSRVGRADRPSPPTRRARGLRSRLDPERGEHRAVEASDAARSDTATPRGRTSPEASSGRAERSAELPESRGRIRIWRVDVASVGLPWQS